MAIQGSAQGICSPCAASKSMIPQLRGPAETIGVVHLLSVPPEVSEAEPAISVTPTTVTSPVGEPAGFEDSVSSYQDAGTRIFSVTQMAQSGKHPRPPPPSFIVEPTSAHTHSLILLHGLGSNGEKFGKELIETGTTSNGSTLTQLLPGARFIFPTSRRRRSTAFGRSMLTQWFDIACLRDPSHRKEVQLRGLAESAQEILDLLEQEMRTIPSSNIILGGLSQGCAMSLTVLLCLDYRIGGLVGMSGYLPFREDTEEAVKDPVVGENDPFSGDEEQEQHDPVVRACIFERDLLCLRPVEDPGYEKTALSTPIFLGHGSVDDKVPCSVGEAMAGTMQRAGYEVEWKCYQGQGHWYKIPDEIDDIVQFLRSVVGWRMGSI
ncbi:Acyl-protein thioesterase [Tolypocladium capitatum]|uniref:Acyl-protein thioesterase n=1 Tax=Tolypocladium capitatum TaxID=45235 RepID=A0A2K3QMG7_9HYPO|nr:Acyl-protein thioesterase [Tolypocladium capitatum]